MLSHKIKRAASALFVPVVGFGVPSYATAGNIIFASNAVPGAQAGDRCFVALSGDNTATFGSPAGWSAPYADSSGNPSRKLIYKTLSSSDVGVTITGDGSNRFGAVMVVIRGYEFNSAATPTTGATSQPNPPLLSMNNGDISLAIAHIDDEGDAVCVSPAGYDDIGYDGNYVSSGSGATAAIAVKKIIATGNEDPGTFTVTPTPSLWAASTVRLTPL